MVSVQIAMPLQINRAHRQDRRVAEKLAQVERMRAMAEDRERELREHFLAAQADVEAARERLLEHEQRLLPASPSTLANRLRGLCGGRAAAALAMSLSSASVITNALRLRSAKP